MYIFVGLLLQIDISTMSVFMFYINKSHGNGISYWKLQVAFRFGSNSFVVPALIF
jgi:hypothetical protein